MLQHSVTKVTHQMKADLDWGNKAELPDVAQGCVTAPGRQPDLQVPS